MNAPGERFVEAVALACRWHGRHVRKGGDSTYVAHLLGVASLILEHGGDEDQAIAGMLHDAIEDAGHLVGAEGGAVSGAQVAAEIGKRFGDRVLRLVVGCTDTETPEEKEPWELRKRRYLDHVRAADPDVLLVSLADKVHNARSLAVDHDSVGERLWERFTGSREQTQWYYTSLAGVFRERLGDVPLVRELEWSIGRIWGAARS